MRPMCPNMRDEQWIEMRDNDPEDFARAVAFERDVRRRDPHAYLHESAVPLDQAVLGSPDQMELGCDSGLCFV